MPRREASGNTVKTSSKPRIMMHAYNPETAGELQVLGQSASLVYMSRSYP